MSDLVLKEVRRMAQLVKQLEERCSESAVADDAFARRCINAARVYPKLDIGAILAAVRAEMLASSESASGGAKEQAK